VERDSRICYHRLPKNLGSVNNFNRVFKMSRGKYFRWAAADDYVAPDHLARCVEILDQNPEIVLCHTRSMLIDANEHDIGEADPLKTYASHSAVRFREVWENLGFCNASYGLIRSDVLRQTALEENYLGSDMVLLAEIALHGKIHEIDEILFFRRMHEGAASSVKDAQLLQKMYDPANKNRHRMYYWRMLSGLTAATSRASLPIGERFQAYWYLFRHAMQNRQRLTRELTQP
jgi:glycosyltransferase involved in cell wall biosynthesis